MRAPSLALALVLAALPLAACTTGSAGPSFQTALATKPGMVDAAEAAALISQYRQSKGKSAVTVDATLMAIARLHSDRMAAANTMTHVLPGEGSFQDRLKAGGYDAGMAAENVAAGQSSLAEVLQDWKNSPSHNENLLEEHIDEIGIAVSLAPDSKYKYFWTLVLGKKRPAGGMAAPSGFTSANGATVTIN
ncbi:MAG TPA: CAP domain-containing protein [Bauldia sp.]|nr:CAP domain-containing protein [Bauldia sp.]